MRLTDRPKSLAEMKPDQAWTPRVQAVMDRALERDVKARYQSASEFGQALYDAVAEMPASAEATAGTLVMDANGTTTVPKTRLSASEPPPAPVKPTRRAPILIGGGVAALLVLGGAVYAARREGDKRTAYGASAAPTVTTPVRDSVPSSGAKGLPSGPTSNVQLAAPLPESSTRVAEATRQSPSYAAELRRLYNTVADSVSADQAEKRLASYRSRSLTRSDSAAVALIAGKAALLVKGFTQGCGIMKRIDASALTGEMKQDLLVALKDCEGP